MTIDDIKIGNWFIGYDDKPFKWVINHYDVVFSMCEGRVNEVIKSPIDLSFEWVDKFVFNRVSENCWNVNIKYSIKFKYGIFTLVIPDKGFDRKIKDLTFVHEMQNIIFELSSEKIKER